MHRKLGSSQDAKADRWQEFLAGGMQQVKACKQQALMDSEKQMCTRIGEHLTVESQFLCRISKTKNDKIENVRTLSPGKLKY